MSAMASRRLIGRRLSQAIPVWIALGVAARPWGQLGGMCMSASNTAVGRLDVGFLGGPLVTGPGPHCSASLERGLALLECFIGTDRLLGVAEVAGRLGLSRSATHRYMMTLQALGFVERGPGRKYRLTLDVTKLGRSATCGIGLAEHARASMRELARRTGFAVELGVLDGPEVLLIERVKVYSRSATLSAEGSSGELRLPVHCTALGKLLLAMVPPDVGRELLDEAVLERCAANTITSRRALREELSQICRSGLAVCDGELTSDAVMIATSVRDERGDIRAALGLSALRSRITAEGLASALGPHLSSAADQISARLGYRRVDEQARVAW
jgi:IclR family transcriptional regulator, pca regulon regulatory protein